MLTLSATCLAIAVASKSGTLRLERRVGRLGEFVAICDNHGLIEVALSDAEASARVQGVLSKVGE